MTHIAENMSPIKLAPRVVLTLIPSAAGVRATKLLGEVPEDIAIEPL